MSWLADTAYASVNGSGSAAGSVDSAFLFIACICAFFFLLTQGLLIYFAVRYRRKRADSHNETEYITGNTLLEAVWIIIPSIVVVAIFAYGYYAYKGMMQPVPGAMEVDVTARQWMWEFAYPNGKRTMNELRVASGEPVMLKMGSDDVIHSFYVPDYRIKRDVVPGTYTVAGFTPGDPGEHHIFCAEFCGTGHSNMNARLVVMEPGGFHEWLESEGDGGGNVPLAEQGEKLVKDFGCTACHSTDGSRLVGPSFSGIYGRNTEFEDGSSLTVDDAYILESLMDPKAKVVKGFPPAMPTYKDSLDAGQVNAIIAYLKSLGGAEQEGAEETDTDGKSERETAPDPAAGEKLFGTLGCSACHSTDGSAGVGPSLRGIMGSERRLAGGTAATAGEAYIRESILDPGAKVVDGFQPIMPPFKGAVSDEQLADIAEYIRTLD